MDSEMRDFMLRKGEKESTPSGTPPKEKSLSSPDIDAKRTELEILKIDKEIEKLTKPDTNIDYYAKMLELQKQHSEALLKMLQSQYDLKLELEKLKISGEGGDEDNTLYFLEMLKPYLPQILAQKNALGGSTINETPIGGPAGGGDKMMTADKVLEYKERIKKGEISEEQAYKDFCIQTPEYAKIINREQFTKEYEKIKNEK